MLFEQKFTTPRRDRCCGESSRVPEQNCSWMAQSARSCPRAGDGRSRCCDSSGTSPGPSAMPVSRVDLQKRSLGEPLLGVCHGSHATKWTPDARSAPARAWRTAILMFLRQMQFSAVVCVCGRVQMCADVRGRAWTCVDVCRRALVCADVLRCAWACVDGVWTYVSRARLRVWTCDCGRVLTCADTRDRELACVEVFGQACPDLRKCA